MFYDNVDLDVEIIVIMKDWGISCFDILVVFVIENILCRVGVVNF